MATFRVRFYNNGTKDEGPTVAISAATIGAAKRKVLSMAKAREATGSDHGFGWGAHLMNAHGKEIAQMLADHRRHGWRVNAKRPRRRRKASR